MKSVQLYRSICLSVCVTSIAALSSSCSVLAQGGSMQNSTPASTQTTNSSLSAVDRQFIKKAAQSDMTEIKTSQLALQRSSNPKVKQFAQMMITQHTESSNKLKPIAAAKKVTLPNSPDKENSALVSQLTKLAGTQFDQAYMNGQVRHPQQSWWLDECDRPKGGCPC
ncbi:MAG: hypothetical protein C4288_09905 [Leptolyngbya sp. ERB_1_1]